MIYLQAHVLFTENISLNYVIHGNGHTFEYFYLGLQGEHSKTMFISSSRTCDKLRCKG